MKAQTYKLGPLTLAVLLHGALFASMLVSVNFGASVSPALPLAITGTLVTENAIVAPPRVEPREPELEPEPVPDTSEQDRIALEEQKRLEDARIERERLARIEREAEQKRQAEEAERKRIAAENERKRLAEEEAAKERRRVEAERKRQEEIERQRAENERLRREAEAAARQAELDAEDRRIAARTADAKAAYMFRIQQRISQKWVRPPTATAGLECTVRITQSAGGEVLSVIVGKCEGDATVRESIERAVYNASPLPTPRDPGVFDRNLTLIFRPTD